MCFRNVDHFSSLDPIIKVFCFVWSVFSVELILYVLMLLFCDPVYDTETLVCQQHLEILLNHNLNEYSILFNLQRFSCLLSDFSKPKCVVSDILSV